ncbi:MAG: hypothetical protein ACLFN8_04690 [Candidatus Woesearchaeota archaeon]
MIKIRNEKELMVALKQYSFEFEKQNTQIIAGHMPLLYVDDEIKQSRRVELGVDRWGEFSKHTFDLGARLCNYLLNEKEKSEILVIVDDLVEMPKLLDSKGVPYSKEKTWMGRKRNKFYLHNDLPSEFYDILNSNNLSADVLKEQIVKEGAVSKILSEKKMKLHALNNGLIAPNECATSLQGLLYDSSQFNKQEDLLIGFIPGQCKGNVCSGLLDRTYDLNSLFVFFPHMEELGGLIQNQDGSYVKNKFAKPLSIGEMYERGVYLRRDVAK